MKNNKTTIKAEIVAHSLSPQGDELISVLCTFPRIILAEVNTHRMLSKNTSSSRAIPFKKMVEAIKNDPFIPIAWQKEHTGMQGYDYFNVEESKINRQVWLEARDSAVENAQQIHNYEITKQLANRLLEPFMWTTMLITGSREGWENFFNLRCPQYNWQNEGNFKSWKDLVKSHFNNGASRNWIDELEQSTTLERLQNNKGQAEIHMMALAECIYDAINESTPLELESGAWHIPFEDKLSGNNLSLEEMIKCSVAMAAHTSYTIVGGEAVKSYEKWIELHDKLIAYDPPHSSPMEHCARAMSNEEFVSFTKSIHSTSNKVEKTNQGGLRQGEVMVDDFIVNREEHYGWCNNLKGFIPYRYFIDNNRNFINNPKEKNG